MIRHKAVLFNGPPGSGKDECGNILHRYYARMYPDVHIVIDKFARGVKVGTHEMHELDVPHDHYEDIKDLRNAAFKGKTPREAYIHYSEVIMKPKHGEKVFGDMLVDRLRPLKHPVIVMITDSGFLPEAESVVDFMGSNNVMMFQLVREGCSFKGDSRSYVDVPHIHTIRMSNDRGIEELRRELLAMAHRFIIPEEVE